jgi:hypothetical protein
MLRSETRFKFTEKIHLLTNQQYASCKHFYAHDCSPSTSPLWLYFWKPGWNNSRFLVRPTYVWDSPWLELDRNRIHLSLLGILPSICLRPFLSVHLHVRLLLQTSITPVSTHTVIELPEDMPPFTEMRFSVCNLITKQRLCVVRKIGSFLLQHNEKINGFRFTLLCLQKPEKKMYESTHSIVHYIVMVHNNSERCHGNAV